MTPEAKNIAQLERVARRLNFTATRVGEPGCLVRAEATDDEAAVRWAIERLKAPALPRGELERALREARDLLLERIHGNPARSAAHNARLTIEWALSALTSKEQNNG